MKNLIRKIIGIGILLFFAISIFAQDYKVNLSAGGKVIIHEVDEVDIEGYNGTDVVIQGESNDREEDERAAGLRVISGSGNVDNTGLGLSAKQKGNELTIEQIGKNSEGRYTIKIPQGVTVLYEHSSHEGDDLNIRNFTSEIEVSAHFNEVNLENVTGPMSINTVHGDVEANFTKVNQSNPVTIRSSHGFIDVTLPQDTKANLKLRSSHGDMFTDFSINTNVQNVKGGSKKKKDDCWDCKENTKMTGAINGGGVLVDLYTAHSNIYLRKKK